MLNINNNEFIKIIIINKFIKHIKKIISQLIGIICGIH